MAMDPHITVPQNPSVPNTPPPDQPAPEGPPILTVDDLKHLQDQGIYLQTRDPQVHAGLKATIREAIREELAAQGVLTVSNFGAAFRNDPNVYQRIADTAYQSDVEAERHEPPGG